MMAEPRGFAALERLLDWNALRLWDPEYQASAKSVRRVRDAARLSRWATRAGVGLDAVEVAMIALLSDQRVAVAARCLTRLAIGGDPGARLLAAATAAPLARRLDGPNWRAQSQLADTLRSQTPQVLIGAWLRGSQVARSRIEWFLTRAQTVRPLLTGDDVVALGVPRGPQVGACLAALRRLRLDRRVATRRQERAFVLAWAPDRGRDTDRWRRRLEREPEIGGCEQGMRGNEARRAQTRRGVST